MDLADGHATAVDNILKERNNNGGTFKAYNLGTGFGSSVLQVCWILHNSCLMEQIAE